MADVEENRAEIRNDIVEDKFQIAHHHRIAITQSLRLIVSVIIAGQASICGIDDIHLKYLATYRSPS